MEAPRCQGSGTNQGTFVSDAQALHSPRAVTRHATQAGADVHVTVLSSGVPVGKARGGRARRIQVAQGSAVYAIAATVEGGDTNEMHEEQERGASHSLRDLGHLA